MHLPAPLALTPRRTRALIAATLITAATAACSDSPTEPRSLPLTVSGTITNRSGAAIPANARVVVFWATSDDPGSPPPQIFGEGTVDAATNRFTITFDRDLPAEALLGNVLGIGFVILTTDPDLREGPVPEGYDPSNFLGITEKHAVIYLNERPARFAPDWPSVFRRGYNVGRGVEIPGATYDDFAPADLDSMVLVIDDWENIDLVNWS